MSCYSLFLFELVDRQDDHAGCSIETHNSNYYSKCNWIISKAIGEVATSLVVLFFTLLIIKALIRARSFRKQNSSENDPKKGSNVDMQLTAMLVTVAIVFFLFRAPYTINYYLSHNRTTVFSGSAEYMSQVKTQIRAGLDVTFFFYTLNHSINFFLYCFSGSKFRLYLRMAFGKEPPKTANTSIMSLSATTKGGGKEEEKPADANTKI
jgi:hypothetical protein